MVHIFPNRGIFHIATIFSNIGEWSNATIFHLMQLYATYATICNLCNYMQLMQLYATYATICNYMQQFHMQLYATMQHATYAT
jgi:hypothetical protein